MNEQTTHAPGAGPNPELRGQCEERSKAAVAADPTLTLVCGWYHDPVWGRQEHWWTTRADGTIHDPTAGQFPHGGITALYEEYSDVFPCDGCGIDVNENDHVNGCCSSACYGRMVGVF